MTFSASEPDITSFGMNTRIAQASDRVVIAHPSTGLTLFRIPAEIKAKAKVPLHLKPPKIPAGTGSGRLQFEVAAAGGGEGRTFVLHNAAPGLAIDARTGRITIDGAEICRQARTQDPEVVGWLRNLGRQRKDADEAEYLRTTGRELGKDQVPLAVTAVVGVADKEGASDRMTLFPIVTFSKEEFEKLFPPPATPTVPASTPKPEAAPATSPEERLRLLEERLRRTEAALDAALERIDALKTREKTP